MTTPEDMNIQGPEIPTQAAEATGEATKPLARDAEEAAKAVPQGSPHYVIDPSRAGELHRSLAVLLMSRRCPSCKARLGASQQTPSEEEHIREIAECCASQERFIRPEMPLQEIVFRSILAEGNRPVKLEHLHHLVTERWYTPNNPRSLSIQGLERVLDNDLYYGFKDVPQTPVEG